MVRGSSSFFVVVHDCMETITYKKQSQLWNDMFAAPNISTGVPLNQLYIVIEIPEQGNRVRLLFHKMAGGYRLL